MLRTVSRLPGCRKISRGALRCLQTASDLPEASSATDELELSTHLHSAFDVTPRRPERRSPAAVYGTKKMPAIQIPSELENKMERLFGEQDVKATRASYQLFLNTPNGLAVAQPFKVKESHKDLKPTALVKQKPAKKGVTLDLDLQPLKLIPARATPTLVYAHAAGQMPAQYAIMRNIFRELRARIGWETGEDGEGGVHIVDWNAGYGPAAWAAMATFPTSPKAKNTYVHIEPNKQVASLSQVLLEPNTPGPVQEWDHHHHRSYVKYAEARPDHLSTRKSIAVSSFQLSGIRTPAERRRTLRQMWESNAEVLVIADLARKDSSNVVLEAREFFISLGNEQKAAAKERRRQDWLERTAREAAEKLGTPPPGPPTSPAPPTTASSSSESSDELAGEPSPPTRGRRRPGARLPRAFMREVQEDKEGDRVNKPDEDGKERFELDGIEYEEISFEEATRPTETPEGHLVAGSAAGSSTALAATHPRKELGCHIVAPCPHEQACPLASTPDFCHFTQLVEQPFFTRATKNSKVGVVETKMSYFILRRGFRPKVAPEVRGEGRVGEVARELLEKDRAKELKLLVEGDGGVYEPREDLDASVEAPSVDFGKLRQEAMEWGRMIYPPLIRKGIVTADLCGADGNLSRHTYPRSLGRQVWYDLTSSQWGDAIPHTSRSSTVRTRGITKLAPAHKTNTISIHNGKVSGLQSLSKVEYREVELLMTSLGIPLPEKTGRKNRELIMEKRAMEPTGWDAPTGWGVGDEIHGYDGSGKAQKEAEAKRNVGRIVRSVGVSPLVSKAEEVTEEITKTKLRKGKKAAAPKGEWSLDGGWISHDASTSIGERTPADLDALESEWEPTPLVGARVIDRSDEIDDRRWSYDDPDLQSSSPPPESSASSSPKPSLASTFTDPSAPLLSSAFTSQTSSGAKPFFDAADIQAAGPSSSFGEVSLAPPASIDLSALGPGWMESYDDGAPSSPSEQRAMIKDRSATFKRLGIRVPKNRSRSVKDDWDLLEAWENQKDKTPDRSSSRTPSPAKTRDSDAPPSSQVDADGRPDRSGRKRRKPWLAPHLVRSRRKDFLRY